MQIKKEERAFLLLKIKKRKLKRTLRIYACVYVCVCIYILMDYKTNESYPKNSEEPFVRLNHPRGQRLQNHIYVFSTI